MLQVSKWNGLCHKDKPINMNNISLFAYIYAMECKREKQILF